MLSKNITVSVAMFVTCIFAISSFAQSTNSSSTPSASSHTAQLIEEAGLGHLSPEDKIKLINLLGKIYTLSASTAEGCPQNSVGSVKSRIDGDFEGWEGESIYKLQNGQIWQQSGYTYTYRYGYNPEVLIFKDGLNWKMQVDGVDKIVTVKCISYSQTE